MPTESTIYRKIRLESLEAFPEAYGTTYQEALKIEKFRIESDIENQLLDRFVLGAFSDLQLIGICTFVKTENNIGNLYQMYVRKEFQRKNIGNELIHAVIDEARSQCKDIDIFLEVASGNERAYQL